MDEYILPPTPAWVTTGTIGAGQAHVLMETIKTRGARNVVEIGTASGYSAVVIAKTLASMAGDWSLDTLDYGEQCYFDPSKRVGQCIEEMTDPSLPIAIHRSSVSLNLPSLLGDRMINLVYIDASHSSPWAALDVLGVLANLKPDAIIALDDILLPFRPGYSHQNAARDLYRIWRGPKWSDPRAPNMGIMRMVDRRQALTDIVTSIWSDWDEDLSDDDMDRVIALLGSFGDLDYPGKSETQLMLAGARVKAKHGNNFTALSTRPFARGSSLHPNDGARNPVASWHGLTVPAGATIRMAAVAFNPEPSNPGAILDVRLTGAKGAILQEETLPLRPRIHSLTRPMTALSGQFGIEIEVTKADGASSSFAGIRVGRFVVTN